jgi:arylsulfatase A-like enzyme
MKDIPAGWIQVRDNKLWMWQGMLENMGEDERQYRQAVRAYQASSTFADDQIGRLLDALDESGASANTVIVLWSDHGYHLGEKEHWEKFALWEKATRVPLIVVAPGAAAPGARCERPVDLAALFPTLVDLANLPPVPGLDGASLQPLLANPSAARPVPALITYQRGNHAVRDEHWRYIRYANGDEELYDHRQDPLEWNNLIGDPRHDPVVARLASWLPVEEAELVEPARAVPGR